MIWDALVIEGEKIQNGEKRRENREKLRTDVERFIAAFQWTAANPDATLSRPLGERLDRDFQAFAAADIGSTDSFS